MHAFQPPPPAGSQATGQATAGVLGQGAPPAGGQPPLTSINSTGSAQQSPPTLEALIANLTARVAALETAASASKPTPPPAASPQPSKCRGVIFRDSTGNESAATITAVRTTGVDLVVFRNDALPGLAHNQPQIDPSTEGAVGWFWPPRV